jgi:hypothetical protein
VSIDKLLNIVAYELSLDKPSTLPSFFFQINSGIVRPSMPNVLSPQLSVLKFCMNFFI